MVVGSNISPTLNVDFMYRHNSLLQLHVNVATMYINLTICVYRVIMLLTIVLVSAHIFLCWVLFSPAPTDNVCKTGTATERYYYLK